MKTNSGPFRHCDWLLSLKTFCPCGYDKVGVCKSGEMICLDCGNEALEYHMIHEEGEFVVFVHKWEPEKK